MPLPADTSSPPGVATAADGGSLFDDLVSLLCDLREAGYSIGLDQFLSVQQLLVTLAVDGGLADPARLRSLVGPVVCKTPAQQADFPARFDGWVAGRRDRP